MEEIKKLSEKREQIWKNYQNLDIEEPKEIDSLAAEIIAQIKEKHDVLPFEFIIEELTKLGFAPSLIYDDNGRFAIGDNGYQDISIKDEPSEKNISFFIEKNDWKNNIRAALRHYLHQIYDYEKIRI
jgi:hypothetical protein